MDINVDLLQRFIRFSIKKKLQGGGNKNENISNKELAEELHKPVIRKFNKRKVHCYRQYLGVGLAECN